MCLMFYQMLSLSCECHQRKRSFIVKGCAPSCVCMYAILYMRLSLSVILSEQAIELMYDILILVFVHDFNYDDSMNI